jgi:hypothetical protein
MYIFTTPANLKKNMNTSKSKKKYERQAYHDHGSEESDVATHGRHVKRRSASLIPQRHVSTVMNQGVYTLLMTVGSLKKNNAPKLQKLMSVMLASLAHRRTKIARIL